MALLTRTLVREAIELSLPTIRETLSKYSWGPEGVVIAVDAKGLDKPFVYLMEELGPEEIWPEKWGEDKNFREIALNKAHIARVNGTTSFEVVNRTPWCLEQDDFLYQGGVAEDTDLGIGISGSYGVFDEGLAWGVWNLIVAICCYRVSEFQAAGLNRLP